MMRRTALFGVLAAALGVASPARADDAPAEASPGRRLVPPDNGYGYVSAQHYPPLLWFATQLLPSPEVGFGSIRRTEIDGRTHESLEAAFGLRWMATPLLWSWGTNRRVSRWRTFVVDPLARNSGSLELDVSFEYLWGHVDRALVRPGVKATFPLVQRGEYLSFSLGTSTYTYDQTPRVAYDAGLYFLFGILGAEVSIAPVHRPLQTLATLRIRYF